jgi:hypothetical protein
LGRPAVGIPPRLWCASPTDANRGEDSANNRGEAAKAPGELKTFCRKIIHCHPERRADLEGVNNSAGFFLVFPPLSPSFVPEFFSGI